jgi:hypothetical protein
MLCVDVFFELLEWGVVQIRISCSSDPVGSVCSPWPVVSMFLHISLSNSLPLFLVTVVSCNLIQERRLLFNLKN